VTCAVQTNGTALCIGHDATGRDPSNALVPEPIADVGDGAAFADAGGDAGVLTGIAEVALPAFATAYRGGCALVKDIACAPDGYVVCWGTKVGDGQPSEGPNIRQQPVRVVAP